MRSAREVAADEYCIENPINPDPRKRCHIAPLPEGLTWDDIAQARERIHRVLEEKKRVQA